MNKVWHWIPGVSVGPFKFGERADRIVADYFLVKRKPDCSIADWDTYELPGFESWIVVKDGCIIEIYCADTLEYRGRELIGVPTSEIIELLGEQDEKELNVGLGYALYYYQFGLTLFITNEIVSAAVCGLIDWDAQKSN